MGGVSTEHDISLITGIQAINNIDKNKYAIYPIVIDKKGKWHFLKDANCIESITKYFADKKHNKIVTIHDKSLYLLVKNKLKKVAYVDCALFCLHGGVGENGAIAGFFEAANIPITCPDHTFSGIFMNKALSKNIFKELDINCTEHVLIDKYEYQNNKAKVIAYIKQKISLPCCIKPNSQGSSIGVSIAKTHSQLLSSIEEAFCFDTQVIVENAITDLFELNIAIIKKDNKVCLSMIEKPSNKNKMLSFEDKYMERGKTSLDGMKRELPAIIDEEITRYVEKSAEKVYKNFIRQGVVRIDYLVDKKTNKVYINEVNTIPGSLSFYLWKDKMSFLELLDVLIEGSIESQKYKEGVKTTFESSVLDKYSGGAKLGLKV